MPHIPFGEDDALTARAIWRIMDCWSEAGTKDCLAKLVDAGAVKRRRMGTPSGFQWIYWQE